jgi:hypothetical protein
MLDGNSPILIYGAGRGELLCRSHGKTVCQTVLRGATANFQSVGRGGSAGKQVPPQPGTIPALGLRAGRWLLLFYRRPALERRNVMSFSSWLRNGKRSGPTTRRRTRYQEVINTVLHADKINPGIRGVTSRELGRI